MRLNPNLIKILHDKYFIPFIRSNNNNNNNNNNNTGIPHNHKVKLQHGKIYEVYIDKNYKVVGILKQRLDKIYPNSRKCVESIVKKRNMYLNISIKN